MSAFHMTGGTAIGRKSCLGTDQQWLAKNMSAPCPVDGDADFKLEDDQNGVSPFS